MAPGKLENGAQCCFSKLHCRFNSGLQSSTRWDPCVEAAMLRRPEPSKERVELMILSIIAIEITHLTIVHFCIAATQRQI